VSTLTHVLEDVQNAMFKEFSTKDKELELLRLGYPCFGTNFIMLLATFVSEEHVFNK
jgi:hypothetical protein